MHMKKILLITIPAVAAVALITGVLVWIFTSPADSSSQDTELIVVHKVRIVLQKYIDASVDENSIDVPKRPEFLRIEDPDYYLEIVLRDDEVIKTAMHKNTPIGNGLEWFLEKPIPLSQFYEVRLFDKELVGSDYVDRVLVTSGSEQGQYFDFHFEPAPQPVIDEAAPGAGDNSS